MQSLNQVFTDSVQKHLHSKGNKHHTHQTFNGYKSFFPSNRCRLSAHNMAPEVTNQARTTASSQLSQRSGAEGNVGHRVARYARGFEMNVQAFDPYIGDEIFERHAVLKVDWETLISFSDIISVHVPLNEETRGMVGKEEFEMMKQGVFLLNTACGGGSASQPLPASPSFYLTAIMGTKLY